MIPADRPTRFSALAACGSAFLIFWSATIHTFGMTSGAMPLWQVWPHMLAILMAGVMLVAPTRLISGLGGLAVAAALAGGVLRSGVERGWWSFFSHCRGSAAAGAACDGFNPALLGLSMANWNALLSAGLLALWVAAAVSRQRRPFVLVNIPS